MFIFLKTEQGNEYLGIASLPEFKGNSIMLYSGYNPLLQPIVGVAEFDLTETTLFNVEIVKNRRYGDVRRAIVLSDKHDIDKYFKGNIR